MFLEAGELDEGEGIVNRGDGQFTSKANILKEVVEIEDHPMRADLIIALNQLLALSKKSGCRANKKGAKTTRSMTRGD